MKESITRHIEKKIFSDLHEKEYIAIIGPRQAGKTTLLNKIYEVLLDSPNIDSNQVKIVTFQDPLQLNSFSQNPLQYVRNYLDTSTKKHYLLIDEYQYAKNGGHDLKLIYDSFKNVKIIITGSSSLELRQIASQMVGRMFQYYLGQFTYPEIISQCSTSIKNSFLPIQKDTLDFLLKEKTFKTRTLLPINQQQIQNLFTNITLFGNYPAIYISQTIEKKQARLMNLYNTYVEKDIVKLLQIGNSENFLRLVQYLAITLGQLFSITTVQRELAITYRETKIFLHALEETYLIRKITPYFTNKTVELKKAPLYYFTDTGLRNWSINGFQPLNNRVDIGHLIENKILNRLDDLQREHRAFSKIYFWRKKSGAEVDFIIEKLDGQSSLIPIEVKYRKFITPSVTKSFHSFINEYSPRIGLIITRDYYHCTKIYNTKVLFIPAYLF